MPTGPKPAVNDVHPLVSKLRKAREHKRITRPQLADLAQVGKDAVQNLEYGYSGNKNMNLLSALAAALDLRIALVPRANLEYDPDTVEAACAVVCPRCVGGHRAAERRPDGWVHDISGVMVACNATAIREALWEPREHTGEAVGAQHVLARHRQRQRDRRKVMSKARTFERKEQREAQRFLDGNQGKGKGVPK